MANNLVCNQCGSCFLERKDLSVHIKLQHSMDTPYVCTECGIGFKKETELKVHTIIHAAARELTCKECGIGFQNEVDLKAHIAAHSKDKVFTCSVPTCKSTFPEKKDLDSHLLTHTQSELISKPAQVFTCEHCGCSFSSLEESGKHICTVDTLVKKVGDSSEKDHVCKICGKSFASKYQLEKKHMLIHSSEKPHVCDVCGKGFIEKSRLKRHSYMHTTEKPFVCQMCGRGFTVKKNLKAHEETHKPIDTVNSETNSSERSTPISTPLVAGHFGENINGILTFIPDSNIHTGGLLQIAPTPTPDPAESEYQTENTIPNMPSDSLVPEVPVTPEIMMEYSCDICQSQFEKQIDLEAHSLTHTGSIPKTNLYACQKCKISFSSEEKFQSHRCSIGVSKSPERKYACETCGKLFHQKYSVKKHMLTHSDTKPFVCDICGKGFIERSRLKRHSYTHTQERPFSCEKCGHGYLDRAKCKAHEVNCKGPTMHTKINTIPTSKPLQQAPPTILSPVSVVSTPQHSQTVTVPVPVAPTLNTVPVIEGSAGNLIQLQNVAPTSFIYTQADLNSLNNGTVLATTDILGNTINTVVLQGSLGEQVIHTPLGDQVQQIGQLIPMDTSGATETQSATELLTAMTDKDGVTPVMNLIQDYFVDVPIAYASAENLSQLQTEGLNHIQSVQTDNSESQEGIHSQIDQNGHISEVPVLDMNATTQGLERVDQSKILFSNQLSENDLKVIMAAGQDKELITLSEYGGEFPYQTTYHTENAVHNNSNATIINLEKVALPVTHIQTDHNGTTQYLNIAVQDDKTSQLPQTAEFQQFVNKDGMLMNGGYEFHDIYPEPMDTQSYEKTYDLQSTLETEMKTYAELSNVIVDKLCSESVKLQSQSSPIMPTMPVPMEIKEEQNAVLENHVENSTIDQKLLNAEEAEVTLPLPNNSAPQQSAPKVPEKKEKNTPNEKSKIKATELDEEKPYCCDICGSKFIHHRSLLRHKGIHNNPYVCKLCGRHFSNKYDLEKKHMLTHTSETPFGCNICDKAYKDKKRLRAHMTTHTGLEPFICPVCNKGFSEKKKMTLHISNEHPEAHLFSCPECKRGFSNKKSMQSHISSAHKSKLFNCSECKKHFNTQAALNEHMKIHDDEQKTVACEQCKKEFIFQSPVDRQLLLNTDKPCICQDCSQTHADTSQFIVLGVMSDGKPNQNELQNGADGVESSPGGQLLPTS